MSRPIFRFGRSAEDADYVAFFQPETPANLARTKNISRIHAIAEVRNEQLTLRDGNGSKASLNGSELDGVPLSAKRPTPLEHQGVLKLGSGYFLRIAPILTPPVWEIAKPLGWLPFDQLAPPTIGFVAVEPIGGQRPFIRAVWLLNRAGFHLDEADAIAMGEGGSTVSSAMFFFQSSCFLLANLSLPEDQLHLDGTPIAEWETVPLRTGQTLRIGRRTFIVRIE